MVKEVYARLRASLTRAADYRATFNTDQGRRVLTHLMRKGHIGEPVTVRSDEKGVDPLMSAYRDGTRHMVLDICKILGMTDDQIILQAQEYAEDG